MRKTILLILWLLTFHQASAYARDAGTNPSPELVKASLSPENPAATKPDNWFTALTIYSLIAGVYALYWFKQKT